MRKHRVVERFLALLLFAGMAWAADISGQWKAEWADYGARGGDLRRTTFTFKQNGTNLMGTVTDDAGMVLQIREGQVTEDKVSFVVAHKIGNREATMTYTGRVSGGEITFKVVFPGADRSWNMTAKKVM